MPLRGPVGVPGRPGLGGGGETMAFAGFGWGFTIATACGSGDLAGAFGAGAGFGGEVAAPGLAGAASTRSAEAAPDAFGATPAAGTAAVAAGAMAGGFDATGAGFFIAGCAAAATGLPGFTVAAGGVFGTAASSGALPARASPALATDERKGAADFAGIGAAFTAALRGVRGGVTLVASFSAAPGFTGLPRAGGFMPAPSP